MKKKCPRCKGSRQVEDKAGDKYDCPDCNGTGFIIDAGAPSADEGPGQGSDGGTGQ